MPSNHTTNYSLNQWVKSDQVRMQDFNADNAKIDAALAGLNSGKADKSALSSLQSVVNDKASASALSSLQSSLNNQISSLQSTVSSQGTALSLRNCCFVTGAYVGDGTEGESSVVTLNFSRKPVFIRINSTKDVRSICAVRGQVDAYYLLSGGANRLAFTWGAKSVSWHAVSFSSKLTEDTHFNSSTNTYHYFAILEL